jgi:hypothetical protein
MAFNNVDSLTMGKILQIMFAKSALPQLSTEAAEFEFVKSYSAKVDPAREFRFFLIESLSPSAIQPNDPGTSGIAFGSPATPVTNEYTSKFFEVSGSLQVELNLWERAMQSPAKFGEPVVIRAQALLDSWKRYVAKHFYMDGTGALGVASAAADTAGAGGSVLVTVPAAAAGNSFVGWFELGDKVQVVYDNAGTLAARAPTVASGTFSHYNVIGVLRDSNQVRLQPILSTGAAANLTASNITAADLIFPSNITIAGLTTAVSDYATWNEVHPGLEALGSPGRTVWGLNMAAGGALAPTRLALSGSPVIDERHLGQLLDNMDIRHGRGKFPVAKFFSAPEVARVLIDARETNRRFNAATDNTSGSTGFYYQHYNQRVYLEPTEFCPTNRIWVLPKSKGGVMPVEMPMIDFKQCKVGSPDGNYLAPNSSGSHNQMINQYWKSYLTTFSRMPSAIGSITGFVIS